MRLFALSSSVSILALSLAAVGCAGQATEEGTPSEDAITSNDGVPLELKFSGEVVADGSETPKKAIVAQLQYMQGILTSAHRANAQATMPTISNIREAASGDTKTVTYDVSLAVIWPKNSAAPTSYDVVLPRDATSFEAFNAKYDGTCGRNEYGQETFWHDFNPAQRGCSLADGDVVKARATVTPHPQATKDRHPEYDQIWADDSLDIVAVFGIIGSNTPSDEGARTREKLLGEVKSSLRDATRVEAPETRGVIAESTVSGTIDVAGRARKVNLTAFLVQEASSAGADFERRYGDVTENADLLVYEGHSGLGANINALASATGAKAGKYQLAYFYGCQTLAYLGPQMHEKRIALNGAASDPEGTKYLDIIATALPAYGDDGRSTIGLYKTILDLRAPKSFNQIIEGISPLHLVAVFGEHDNSF